MISLEKQIVPMLGPIDNTTTATKETGYVDISGFVDFSFLISLGVVTFASADTTSAVITIEAATSAASSAAEVQVPGIYRWSAAVATDTWGTPTAFTAATGVEVNASADNMVLEIKVEPATIAGLLENGSFLRVVMTEGENTAFVMGVIGIGTPRYAAATMVSAS